MNTDIMGKSRIILTSFQKAKELSKKFKNCQNFLYEMMISCNCKFSLSGKERNIFRNFILKVYFPERKEVYFCTARLVETACIKMLQRFYEMRKEVTIAMLQLDKDFNISAEELCKIRKICNFSDPVEIAVQYLCQENKNLTRSME